MVTARVIEMSESALIHAVLIVQGEASHRFPRFLSFLPTAHISERFLTLYVSIAVAGHTWYGGGLSTLAFLYDEVPRRWGEFVFSDTVVTRLLPPRHGDASGLRGAAWLWPPGERR